MRRLLLMLAVTLCAGCAPRVSIADRCSNYGFTPGTDAHANCRMRMSAQDDALQQRRGAALTRMGMQMMQPQPSPSLSTYRLPSGQVMHCSTVGTMTSCH